MLHELLIVPAMITPVRGHVAGERDGRQDRERRANALDQLAGPNFWEMRGGPVGGTKTNDVGTLGNLSLPAAKIPLGKFAPSEFIIISAAPERTLRVSFPRLRIRGTLRLRLPPESDLLVPPAIIIIGTQFESDRHVDARIAR